MAVAVPNVVAPETKPAASPRASGAAALRSSKGASWDLVLKLAGIAAGIPRTTAAVRPAEVSAPSARGAAQPVPSATETLAATQTAKTASLPSALQRYSGTAAFSSPALPVARPVSTAAPTAPRSVEPASGREAKATETAAHKTPASADSADSGNALGPTQAAVRPAPDAPPATAPIFVVPPSFPSARDPELSPPARPSEPATAVEMPSILLRSVSSLVTPDGLALRSTRSAAGRTQAVSTSAPAQSLADRSAATDASDRGSSGFAAANATQAAIPGEAVAPAASAWHQPSPFLPDATNLAAADPLRNHLPQQGGAHGPSSASGQDITAAPVLPPGATEAAADTGQKPSITAPWNRASVSLESATQGSVATTAASSAAVPALRSIQTAAPFSGAAASSSAPTVSPTAETFTALDAEASSVNPVWLHAGAQRAEAGYQDPALGWVSVRAGVADGAIHAAIVPGSADAATALGSHLGSLNSYLAERDIHSTTVTVASPEPHSGEAQLSAHQEGAQGFGRGSGEGAPQSARGQPDWLSGEAPLHAAASPATSATDLQTPAMAIGGGVHISVMA